MIRKILFSFLLLALFVTESVAQYAPDSLQIAQANMAKAASLRKTAKTLAITGGSMALLGGGVAGATFLAVRDLSGEGAGMAAALGISLGASMVLTGAITALAGIPFAASGNAIRKIDDGTYWKSASFGDGSMRGFGMVLEGGYIMGDFIGIEFRGVAGYHFNEHVFVGGGIAPCYFPEGIGPEDYIPIDIPVFADLRYSFGSRRLSPYIGGSLGIELLGENWPPETSLYWSAEAGLRMRLSKDNGHALWLSVLGESAMGTGVVRAGLKMGYSF